MRILIIIILNFTSVFACGQDLHVSILIDRQKAHKIVDSLARNYVDEILILQTKRHFNSLLNSDPDSLYTFVVWRQGQVYCAKIITADRIFESKYFDGIGFFDLQKKEKTFVTDDEQGQKLIPPVTGDNALYYLNPKKKKYGYFEQGRPVTYRANDHTKESLRKKWFDRCLFILQTMQIDFATSEHYDREGELNKLLEQN
jgi:hypothetical protein